MTSRASVGILVNDDNCVLFAKRSPTVNTFPGHWEFPGGLAVEGESFLDALARELNEELGVMLETAPQLLRKAHNVDDHGHTWLVGVYVCSLGMQVPRIREPEKCSQIGFFDPRHPPAPLLDAAKEDLRMYLENFNE